MSNSVSQIQPVTTDIFDDIRAGYRHVAERAKHVSINDSQLKAYAMSLPLCEPENSLDDQHHYVTDDPENMVAAVLILDAINFGSGYTDDLVNEGWVLVDNSIYFTVATALKQRFDQYGVYSARQLRDLTISDLIMLLDLPRHSEVAREVAALYRSSINELGAYIEDQYNGRFMGLIKASGGSAANFVSLIGGLNGFHDIPVYQGRVVPIYKRAQHVAASLHGFFMRMGRPLFADIDRLTIFPDCAIPHVLRMDGILEYTPALAARIDAGEIIAEGSYEEIEIRCCAGEAMERMAAIKGLKVVEMDYTLWHRSVEDRRYAEKPAHRTLTRFY